MKPKPPLNPDDVKNIINTNGAPPEGLALQTMAEFLAEPDDAVDWLVDGLLPAGGVSELVAKPKCGKSTLARNLALAVARGTPFLERATSPGSVIYCAFEEKKGEVRRHFRQLGMRPDDPVEILIGRTPEGFLDKLRVSIAARVPAPVLAIIDPMIRVVRVKDIGAYAEVSQAMEPVLDLARESGTHLLLPHHGRKSEGEGGDVSLGSTSIFGTVDTCLLLRKTPDGRRLLRTDQRYGEAFEEERFLLLDRETGQVDLGGSKHEDDVSRGREHLLAFLLRQTEWVSREALLAAAEGTKALRLIALRELVRDGALVQRGEGRRGCPYEYAHPEAGFLVSGTGTAYIPSVPDTGNGEHPEAGFQDSGTASIPAVPDTGNGEPVQEALFTPEAAGTPPPGAATSSPFATSAGWPSWSEPRMSGTPGTAGIFGTAAKRRPRDRRSRGGGL